MPEPVCLVIDRLRAQPDVVVRDSWGETAFFVNPGGRLPSGAYFATIRQTDGPNDRASGLDRPGVWRLSLGIGAEAFTARFGPRPVRPAKGAVVAGPWDFTARDTLRPHPVYGRMGWVAILSPAAETLPAIEERIASAHARADATARRRLAGG